MTEKFKVKHANLVEFLSGATEEVIKDISSLTALSTTSFDADSAYKMAFREGQRSIGLELIKMVDREIYHVVQEKPALSNVTRPHFNTRPTK